MHIINEVHHDPHQNPLYDILKQVLRRRDSLLSTRRSILIFLLDKDLMSQYLVNHRYMLPRHQDLPFVFK